MYAPGKLALILSAVALALPQAAAADPALSKSWTGTWQLNTAKSKFSSAEYKPKKETRTYTLAGNRLTMKAASVNAAGNKMNWGYSAEVNGKAYPTTGNPNTDRVRLTMVGPRKLTSTSTKKGKPSARATLALSADGKQLTITRSLLFAKGGPTNDTLVYDRVK